MGEDNLVTDELREKIRRAHWKETTCGGKIPLHSYITIYKHKEDAELVKELVDLIEKHGYDGYFYKAKFRYLNLDDYKYWHYEDLVNREKIR
ncbi:Uncharacterised protein [Candidatus Gugararchaeum adminiculabundum]|nr:Uncharacterised protein [Candidatus Gugararchaeum adminiculabundum]